MQSTVATERLWDQLLQFMDDGLVIPVLDRELLRVDVEGRSVGCVSEGLEATLGSPGTTAEIPRYAAGPPVRPLRSAR